ncbi:sensor histidine kinase [Ferruginibacter sp.]
MKENYIEELLIQAKRRSDRIMNYFLIAFFITGILLGFYYDTQGIAIGVGSLSLGAYYVSKLLLPKSNLYQYVLSVVLGLFMALYIYQMHGMFEMHFLAFIGSAVLITYRNWKLQIPLAIVVIVHHAAFAYLQFSGVNYVFFFPQEHMTLDTFLIHISLATVIFSLCGLWAYQFKRSEQNYAIKCFEIGKLQEAASQKDVLVAMSESMKQSNHKLQEANANLEKIFNTVQDVLFSINATEQRFIQVSIACINVFGYTPDDFLRDPDLWKKVIHPDDEYVVNDMIDALAQGQTVTRFYRIVHRYKSTRWIETRMVPTLDDEGITVRVDGICTDITEKVKLENKLAHEKKQRQQQITAAVITAQERERSFLGEELHDNINPILATSRLYLDCALSREESRMTLIKDSKNFVSMAMEEIRKLSKKLVAPALRHTGIVEALGHLVESIDQVNPVKFVSSFDCDETLIKEELKLAIYRIVQEQVSNILKHANASTIHLGLKQQNNCLVLSIKDDGVGFDVHQKRSGVGLQNISSRTDVFNGRLNIYSEPGKGCELLIIFPVTPALSNAKKYIRA